jgi:hypothetical protein
MRRRYTLATLTALAALLLAGGLTSAKTTVSAYDVPSETTAGQTFEVHFQLEDHEGLLSTTTDMFVVARPMGATEELTFPAIQDGDKWIAQVTLPEAGVWVFRVRSDELGFQQDLASTTAAENAAAPATTGQLQQELDTLRAELDKRISSAVAAEMKALESEQMALQKQIDGLLAEQQTLRGEITALEASNANQAGLTLSWWLAAAALAGVAMLAAGGALVIAMQRGLLERPRAHSTAH